MDLRPAEFLARYSHAEDRPPFRDYNGGVDIVLRDFRQQDFDNATKELQLATNDNPMPDATDLYVLGVSLQQSNKNPEAAEAFNKCAQIPGVLQDRCKQSAATAKSAK